MKRQCYTVLQRQVMCVSSGKCAYSVRLLSHTTHNIFIKIWTSYENNLASTKLLSKIFSYKQSCNNRAFQCSRTADSERKKDSKYITEKFWWLTFKFNKCLITHMCKNVRAHLPRLNHMLRISKPVSLRISLYLPIMRARLFWLKTSSCNAGWVRNAMAQWKKLFHAWCSNGWKK